jgi:hypothetical protein
MEVDGRGRTKKNNVSNGFTGKLDVRGQVFGWGARIRTWE